VWCHLHLGDCTFSVRGDLARALSLPPSLSLITWPCPDRKEDSNPQVSNSARQPQTEIAGCTGEPHLPFHANNTIASHSVWLCMQTSFATPPSRLGPPPRDCKRPRPLRVSSETSPPAAGASERKCPQLRGLLLICTGPRLHLLFSLSLSLSPPPLSHFLSLFLEACPPILSQDS
jgi:hypothetical protein